MSEPVRELVAKFDRLTDAEKHEALVEILRRAPQPSEDTPEDALRELADELFVAMDAEEAARAGD